MVFGFSTDPCITMECPKGSECKVFPPTGEAYCDPSCDIDNGGCDDDQLCFPGLPPDCIVSPAGEPCIAELICRDEGTVYMYVCSLSAGFEHFVRSHIKWLNGQY